MVLVHVILMATECPSWSSFVLGLSICRNLRLFFESTNRALLCTLVFHPLLFASASTRKPSRLPHEYTCVIQLLSSCRNSPNSIHSNQKLHSASPCPNLPPNLQISFSAWPQVGPSLFTPRGAFHARGERSSFGRRRSPTRSERLRFWSLRGAFEAGPLRWTGGAQGLGHRGADGTHQRSRIEWFFGGLRLETNLASN